MRNVRLEHGLCKLSGNGPRTEIDDCYFRAPILPGSASLLQLDFMTLTTLDPSKADEIIREAHAHGCLLGFSNEHVETQRIKMRNHVIGMQQRLHSAPPVVGNANPYSS